MAVYTHLLPLCRTGWSDDMYEIDADRDAAADYDDPQQMDYYFDNDDE